MSKMGKSIFPIVNNTRRILPPRINLSSKKGFSRTRRIKSKTFIGGTNYGAILINAKSPASFTEPAEPIGECHTFSKESESGDVSH